MTEQKKCENSNGIKFWLLKTLPTFNDYQDAKFEASISRNSHYYKSCDDISTYVYSLCCSSSILCNNGKCTLRIIKKAVQIISDSRKKNRTSPSFLRVLVIFLSNTRLGTGTSYARAMSSFGIQMFVIIPFTNLVVQNAAKQQMTKYHPQKSLSKSLRLIITDCPVTCRCYFMHLKNNK